MPKKRKAIVEQEDKPEPPTRGDVDGRVDRYTEAVKRGERIFEMDKSESTKRACELLQRWVELQDERDVFDMREETNRLLEMIEPLPDDEPPQVTKQTCELGDVQDQPGLMDGVFPLNQKRIDFHDLCFQETAIIASATLIELSFHSGHNGVRAFDRQQAGKLAAVLHRWSLSGNVHEPNRIGPSLRGHGDLGWGSDSE